MIIWRVVAILALLSYPFIVFFGLKTFEPKSLSLALIAMGIFHFLSQKNQHHKYQKYLILSLIIVLSALLQIFNNVLFIKIYPFLMSMIFLFVFASTIFSPPSMIERIARTYDKNLPNEAIKYTKNVTLIWCAFFCINGSISLYTVFFTSLEFWTLYNGFITYILIGTLFATEYIFRQFTVNKK